MSYSSTGYNSCTVSVANPRSTITTQLINTITIFSKKARGYFDYYSDFLNCFTDSQLEIIFNDPVTTEDVSATNTNGDTVVYNIDTTTFTHTLTANQNISNEKIFVVTVVNPLIEGIFKTGYKLDNQIHEVPMTEQITLTTEYVDKNDIPSSFPVVSDVDLKHAFLNNTHTVDLDVDYSETDLIGYDSFCKVIQSNGSWVNNGRGAASGSRYKGYTFTGDILIEFYPKREKTLKLNYPDGKKIKFKVALIDYNGNYIDEQYFDEDKTNIITFKVSEIFTTSRTDVLVGVIVLIFDNPYSEGVAFYFDALKEKFNGLTNISFSPKIINIQVDETNKKKVNMQIRNGVSSSVYYLFPRNFYNGSNYTIQPDGNRKDILKSTDKLELSDRSELTITLP